MTPSLMLKLVSKLDTSLEARTLYVLGTLSATAVQEEEEDISLDLETDRTEDPLRQDDAVLQGRIQDIVVIDVHVLRIS